MPVGALRWFVSGHDLTGCEKLDGERLVGLKATSRRQEQRGCDGTPEGVPFQNWSSPDFSAAFKAVP
jgi:hypothetical protein